MNTLDSKIPEGPLAQKWTNYKANQRLVNPANKRKLDVIVVGTGLAGASTAASLAPLRMVQAAPPAFRHSFTMRRAGKRT
ncbi:MAG: hypothetical protein IKT84_00295, partial [Bacteroidales bacterium]|nr:hypothetical protein [Bacteroidales bacterium]